MMFYAESSSLDFPQNVVYIFKVVNNSNRVFACNFFNESFYDDIYLKYTQILKLLLATIAKWSFVAKV